MNVRIEAIEALDKLVQTSPTHSEELLNLLEPLATDEEDDKTRKKVFEVLRKLRPLMNEHDTPLHFYTPLDNDGYCYNHSYPDASKIKEQAANTAPSAQGYKFISNVYETLSKWFQPSPSLQKVKTD